MLKQISGMLIILLTGTGYSFAQNQPGASSSNKKDCPGTTAYWGLNCFLNSEFMQKFADARSKAEQSVRDFKALDRAEHFSNMDIESVKDAYNASAAEFNDILYTIKGDLLDRKYRKLYLAKPEKYSDGIEHKLSRAQDFYANNYQKSLAQTTQGRITGATFLALVPEIIKYAKLAFEIYKQIKSEVAKYNNSLFDKYLIEEYRFRTWDEIK